MSNVLCAGFFDCTSVLTKSVAEMTSSLAYVLNVAFVALYHINETGMQSVTHQFFYPLRCLEPSSRDGETSASEQKGVMQ